MLQPIAFYATKTGSPRVVFGTIWIDISCYFISANLYVDNFWKTNLTLDKVIFGPKKASNWLTIEQNIFSRLCYLE